MGALGMIVLSGLRDSLKMMGCLISVSKTGWKRMWWFEENGLNRFVSFEYSKVVFLVPHNDALSDTFIWAKLID